MDSYSLQIVGSVVYVAIPDQFRNSVWSNHFGPIQRQLRSLPKDVESVVVNGENCNWIDPFPLLSLLISLAELHTKKRICYLVPNVSERDLTSEKKRVLEFLSKEGFFEVMLSYNINIIETGKYHEFKKGADLRNYSKTLLANIRKSFDGYLCYDNCTIWEAQVIDLGSMKAEKEINEMVDNKLEDVKHRILPHIPGSFMNEVIWKIGLFLKESINNVLEHAYDNGSSKYVGVYLRHRVGLMNNSLSSDMRRKLEDSIENEKQDVTRLISDFPKGATNFFEIFVIDAGVGLTMHFKSKRPLKSNSFREAWRETVGLGQRSGKEKKYTQFGGLYTLGKLLVNEYMLARDYDCWIGDTLPVEHINASYIHACKSSDSEHFILGLAVMSRISVKNPMDNNGWVLSEETGNCFSEVMKEKQSIYEKYYQMTSSEMPHPLCYIKDERFDLSFIEKAQYLEQKDNVKFCIFLPSEHTSKNEIFKNVSKAISDVADVKNESRSIIIADIPVCECGLYQFAIENATFGSRLIKEIDRIILLSQRLSVRVLVKDKGKFGFSEVETNKYIRERTVDFLPHMSLYNVIEWLKTHDSMLLWHYIFTNNERMNFFVNQKIKWYGEDFEYDINGYLDFEKTLTDSFLKHIYQNVLQRTLCLGYKIKCNYSAEDPLMIGLASYMNMLYYNTAEENGVKSISLGSVYVSGTTQARSVDICVNLFQHKTAEQIFGDTSVNHLLAWPKNDQKEKRRTGSVVDFNYRRVGSTYAIAPFGWRYFPIPRFKARSDDSTLISKYIFTNEEANRIEFQSIYKCLPKDTYNYWQGHSGAFLGISHIDYETKHDILNIDFPFIVKESFLLGGDLACFILGEVISAFGINLEDVDFHGNDKFKENVAAYCSVNGDKYESRNCSILVYPYHSHTEAIIDILRGYLSDQIQMIPLIPINNERNGTSFQPSPLTMEMLRKTVDELIQDSVSGKVDVLFFDDAIVDGKTQDEIKHILYSLGVACMMSLFILERRRIPFNTSDYRKSSVFWRLDIPRLGSKYNCPLCAALNSISDFSSQVISENAKGRINQWINAWEAKTENTIESIHTIIPIKLNIPEEKAKKRFGIYFKEDVCKQCGGESNKIELQTSLGLTLYMGELLSITSRDDKMLQYCSEKYQLGPFALIEMLCTNLLLYGNTITRKVRAKYVLHIFENVNQIEECNNHTAFAALVLMTQEKEVLEGLVIKYAEMKRSNLKPNYDMLILLSYLGVKYKETFGDIEDARRLRQTSMTDDKAYRMFHSEIYNDNGKTHSRPIRRLLDDAVTGTLDLKRVSDALDCLEYALKSILDWNFVDWNGRVTDLSVDEALGKIAVNKDIMKSISYAGYIEKKAEIRTQIQDLSNYLSEIHRKLFMPLNIINENVEFSDEFVLFDRLKGWSEKDHYDIGYWGIQRMNVGQSHIFERWMIWDRTVDEELKYLLDNAVQNSGGKIPNPEDGRGDEMHDIWIGVSYAADFSTASLLIYNKKKENVNAITVKEETSKKRRFERNRFIEDLKISVDYYDQKNDVLLTKVTFQLI